MRQRRLVKGWSNEVVSDEEVQKLIAIRMYYLDALINVARVEPHAGARRAY